MKKLIKLSRLLSGLKFSNESGQIISLASELKRLQLAEKVDHLTEEEDSVKGRDQWMMHVAHDLSEILGLHSPAYLGSSVRNLGGAYAFSASNDAGESVVLKIGPAAEMYPYKKLVERFGSNPPSILPKVYQAGTFNQIGYEPPKGLAENFGFIVMEELQKMPDSMADYFYNNNLEETLRRNKDDSSALSKSINYAVNEAKYAIHDLVSNSEVEEKTDRGRFDHLILKLKENLFFKIKSLDLSSNNLEENKNNIINIVRAIITDLFKNYNVESEINMIGGFLADTLWGWLVSSPGDNTELKKHIRDSLGKLESLRIIPYDLHKDNIMIRPDTGEIVFSDLGYFEI